MDIIDGTEIEFIISIWDDNYPEKIDSRTHTLTVTNMITLEGSITSDLTLEEGSYLIDSCNFLTIMPGTKIGRGWK